MCCNGILKNEKSFFVFFYGSLRKGSDVVGIYFNLKGFQSLGCLGEEGYQVCDRGLFSVCGVQKGGGFLVCLELEGRVDRQCFCFVCQGVVVMRFELWKFQFGDFLDVRMMIF